MHRFERLRGHGLQAVFHRFNLVHHEMLHFVSTIHNYIMVEVLESAWKIFQDEVRGVKDLDGLIEV